jgi:hypothetical protein
MLRIFIALKISHSQVGLNPWTLGRVASTLAVTPLRMIFTNIMKSILDRFTKEGLLYIVIDAFDLICLVILMLFIEVGLMFVTINVHSSWSFCYEQKILRIIQRWCWKVLHMFCFSHALLAKKGFILYLCIHVRKAKCLFILKGS